MSLLKLANTNYCVDVSGGDTNKPLQLWVCDENNANQQFNIDIYKNQIIHKGSKKCITRDGGSVKLKDCDDSPDNQWVRSGANYKSKNSNNCIKSMSFDNHTNGTLISTESCNHHGYQKFEALESLPPYMEDCSTTGGNSEQACKDAVNCANKKTNHNIRVKTHNQVINDKYSSLLSKHNSRLSDWRNKTGEFRSFKDKETELRDEREWWAKGCVDGNFGCGFGGPTNDASCKAANGNGWIFAGCSQSDCGLYRRGSCRREEDRIKSDLLAMGYGEKKPIAPVKPIDVQGFDDTTNIQCCNNTIKLGDNSTAKDINQLCNQSLIQTEVKKEEVEKEEVKKEEVKKEEVKKEEVKKEEVKKDDDDEDSYDFTLIIILAILLLLLFSSSGFVLLL